MSKDINKGNDYQPYSNNILENKRLDYKGYWLDEPANPFYFSRFGGYEKNAPGYYNKREKIPTIMFNYTISGKATIEYKGKTYLLQKGDLCLIDMAYPQVIKGFDDVGWEIVFFHSSADLAKRFYLDFIERVPYVLHNYDGSLMKRSILKLHTLSKKGEISQAEIFKTLSNVLISIYDASQKEDRIASMNLRDIVEKNKEKPVSEIAKITGYTTEHFIRLFKKENKVTPYEYIIKQKIAAAGALLVNKNKIPLKDIAQLSGFKSTKAMSYAIKKYFGANPTIVSTKTWHPREGNEITNP